ncbi:hypothetical protein J437_LFUL001226 [Ladona fulva]|uniref:PDZ domain-containing protein 8 n=1 Tax=Ladona fulva TaxID=123851 RepID=A0A8K0JZW6_LADFU|nr:hypothetical protein J437_LFUL001226 [Ladona fulva]
MKISRRWSCHLAALITVMEWTWIMGWLLVILGSLASGVVVTLIVEWYIFQKYLITLPTVPEENADSSSNFASLPSYNLPEALTEALRNSGLGLPSELLDGVEGTSASSEGNGCCLALNLIMQFVFRELRTSDMVRRWFLKKLNLEFEELVTRTTTGKLFEKVSIRDIDLGVEAPVIKRAWVKDVHLHTPQKSQTLGSSLQSPFLDSLEVGLSLLYAGGFRIVTRANMVLGRTAHLSIEVRRLSGDCLLCFRRRPYAHWSLAFVGEPQLDLNVHSMFQGRSLSQVSTLITGQIRKALRKKHTLPNFKMRHKPFLPRDEFVEEEGLLECGGITNGVPAILEVAVLEASRLPENPLGGCIQITLALDCAAWVHLTQTGSSTIATIDIKVNRSEGLSSSASKPSLSQPHQISQIKMSQQPLGLVFQPIQMDKRGGTSGTDQRRSTAVVIIDSVVPGSPCALAGVLPGDALVSIEGKKITSLSQASRILKNVGEVFLLRVERRSRLSISGLAGSASSTTIGKNAIEKPVEQDTDFLLSISHSSSVPMSSSLPSSPAPKRGKVENSLSSAIGPTVVMSQLYTESDITSSLSASIPEIPPVVVKRSAATLEEPSSGMRRNRSSSLPKSRSAKSDEGDSDLSGSKVQGDERKSRCTLQMKATQELIPDEVMAVGEIFTFHINERHRFLNINVWGLSSTSDKKQDDPGTPVESSEGTKAAGSVSSSGSGILRQRRRSSDVPSNSSMSSSSSSSSLSAGGKGLDSSLIVNEEGEKSKLLLARLSIPVQDLVGIKIKEEGGELERHIRCWSLQPPDPFSSLSSKFSQWALHSGFDPNLCFGDILLRVSLTSDAKQQVTQPGTAAKSFTKRSWRTKQEKESLGSDATLSSKESIIAVEEDDMGEKLTKDNKLNDDTNTDTAGHNFVRTQFHRATLCDFCEKKIWLKDAVKCHSCGMVCHKKCVAKCQSASKCPWGGQRNLSYSLMTPEIVTTVEGPSEEEEDDDADVEEAIYLDDFGADGESIGGGGGVGASSRPSNTPTPQRIRTGLGGLLASVAAAASHQASRGLRRAGSAQNLAPGGAQGGSPASSATNVTPSPTAPSPPSTPSLTLSPSPNSPSSNSASTPSLLLLLSRSLPPSPQHSPTASRKTSLAESPFHLPAAIRKAKAKSDSSRDVITTTDSEGMSICLDERANKITLESDALGSEEIENAGKEEVDDEGEMVQEAMNRLLEQHPRLLLQSREDEEAAMGEAKAAGRSLFSSLSPKKRKEKIGKMIAKLEDAMDQEVKNRHDGGPEGARGQVLSILMLHACSGLQHAQDEEEKERLREIKPISADTNEQEASSKITDEKVPACGDEDIQN